MPRKRNAPSAELPPTPELPENPSEHDTEPSLAASGGQKGPQNPPDEPAPDQPEPEPTIPEAWKDDDRAAIAKRARAKRRREIATRSGDPQVQELIEQAGAENEFDQGDETPETPETPAASVATAGDSVTISVYGQSRQVPRAQVLAVGARLVGPGASEQERLEAGLREVQKHESADLRLERAATREALAAEHENQLRVREAALSRAPAPTPPAAPQAPSPPQGVSEPDFDAIARGLYGGDVVEAAQTLREFHSATVAAARSVPADLRSVVSEVVDQREHERATREINEVNTTFGRDYPALRAGTGFDRAQKRLAEVDADPEWRAQSPMKRMREAATRAMTDMDVIERALNGEALPAAPRAPRQGNSILAGRRAALENAGLAGGGTQVRRAAAPETPRMKASDVIREEQRKRGQL